MRQEKANFCTLLRTGKIGSTILIKEGNARVASVTGNDASRSLEKAGSSDLRRYLSLIRDLSSLQSAADKTAG
ncbi:hypothetical protein AMELA_G00073870 [Ameiurus melas]|uniref:Uncharacterized protein n=1 Tax=Ameiurus melas TaxID=219545 RepID=A0A7J6AXZ7_AMEME|nr:hypothetical protein AMELA_G00073870 [Ameiurus melas]